MPLVRERIQDLLNKASGQAPQLAARQHAFFASHGIPDERQVEMLEDPVSLGTLLDTYEGLCAAQLRPARQVTVDLGRQISEQLLRRGAEPDAPILRRAQTQYWGHPVQFAKDPHWFLARRAMTAAVGGGWKEAVGVGSDKRWDPVPYYLECIVQTDVIREGGLHVAYGIDTTRDDNQVPMSRPEWLMSLRDTKEFEDATPVGLIDELPTDLDRVERRVPCSILLAIEQTRHAALAGLAIEQGLRTA